MVASTARALLFSLAYSVVQGSAAECKATATCTAGDDAIEETALLQKRQQVGPSKSVIEEWLKSAIKETLVPFKDMVKVGTPESDRCAWVKYEAKYSLPSAATAAGLEPPMVLATDENMDPRLKELKLDFNGLWWMRYNAEPQELVSFAGATVNSSTYPVGVTVPNQVAGHWSWVDTALPNYLVIARGLTPSNGYGVHFTSDSEGKIGIGAAESVFFKAYLFLKVDEDQWLRPTVFANNVTLNYTLTRVVMGNGTPHPEYWPLFLEHTRKRSWLGRKAPGSKVLISRYMNDWCQAKCELAMPCSVCKRTCR